MKHLVIFAIAAAVFMVIDLLWIGIIAKNFYRHKLGFIFTGEVNWPAVVVFYAIYIAGILYFAVHPALKEQNVMIAVIKGAALGLLCYGTYDLTNMATIKQWPLIVTVVDMLWGTFLTCAVSAITALIAIKLYH